MNLTKDPDAVLDYVVNWSPWLGTDTITTSEWLVPAGLTKVTDSKTATSATIWLSGGTVGMNYTVTNRIVTVGGRTEDRSFTLRLQER